MTTDKLIEKFEEAFLDGRSRDDIMVSSCLHRGANGLYFNFNTQLLFNWFAKGAGSVVVELPSANDGKKVFPEDYRKAIEAAGGTVKS